MSDKSNASAALRERLSALLDGELERGAVPEACARWRDDASSRSAWHAYGLIGDVLRSDDLAGAPSSGAAFLSAFRARMASEPVVLAPQPSIAPAGPTEAVVAAAAVHRARRRAWLAPTAVAAGFVAVAGVLTLTRPGFSVDPGATDRGPQLAASTTSTASTARVGAPAPEEAQTFVASGDLIRDARLDRYLAAHKQFAGSSALGVPSANLRNATVEVSGRR